MNKRKFRRNVGGLLRDRYQAMPRMIGQKKWRAVRLPDGTVRITDKAGCPKLVMPWDTFKRAMVGAGYRMAAAGEPAMNQDTGGM